MFSAILASGLLAVGQCPGGVCYPPAAVVANPPIASTPAPVKWEVNRSPYDKAVEYAIYCNGELHGFLRDGQVCFWDKAAGKLSPWSAGGKWYPQFSADGKSVIKDPPAKVAEPQKPAEQGIEAIGLNDPRNFGIDYSQLGEAVNESIQAEASLVPDESGKPRLTIRSDDKALVAKIMKAIEPIKDKMLVQAYPPGHWALRPGLDVGLVTVEAPPVDGKGKVLHLQQAYENDEALLKALRKADPSYVASAAPDLSKDDVVNSVVSFLQSTSPIMGLKWYVVLAGAAVLFLMFKGRQNAQ